MSHPPHTLDRAGVVHPPGTLAARRVAGPHAVPARLEDGPVADVLAFLTEHRARLLRVGLHLVVAALPLLAISAHVFGVAPMNVTAGLVVVPLTLLALMLGLFSPAGEERLVLAGAMWGLLATLVYDAVRLDTVYLLGWWGDFIPRVGTWIVGVDPDASVLGAVVGYVWRYAGDGGGIGVAFFVLVAATGLRRWGERATVTASVVFAVFPVWTGLVATVALAPRGPQLMFPLTPVTVALSLVGHLVFGLVLGLGCARCQRLEQYWPWTPLLDLRRTAPHVRAAPLAMVSPASPRRRDTAERWGPPALVAPPEDDAERTEIRVERPVPLRRGGAGPRTGRRGSGCGRAAGGAALSPEGRGGSRGAITGPSSGPVRLADPRPRAAPGLDCPSGPVPLGDRRSGPVPLADPRSGPVPLGDPRSGPVPLGDPRSGPVSLGDPRSGPVPTGRPSGPASGPSAGRAANGGVPPGSFRAGPTSRPVRVPEGGAGSWSRAVPGDVPDPWLGGRAATSSAKAHPDLAARG